MYDFREKNSIEHAQQLIEYFSSTYHKLFGKAVKTYTYHCVSKHLVDDCVKHGSLMNHTMFSLESVLGHFESSLNENKGLHSQFVKSKN